MVEYEYFDEHGNRIDPADIRSTTSWWMKKRPTRTRLST